jgi:uncharacterized protein YlaI
MSRSTSRSKIKKLVENAIAKVLNKEPIGYEDEELGMSMPGPIPTSMIVAPEKISPPKTDSDFLPTTSPTKEISKQMTATAIRGSKGKLGSGRPPKPISQTLASDAPGVQQEVPHLPDASDYAHLERDPLLPRPRDSENASGALEGTPWEGMSVIDVMKMAKDSIANPVTPEWGSEEKYKDIGGTEIGDLRTALKEFPNVRLSDDLEDAYGARKPGKERFHGTQQMAQTIKALAYADGGNLQIDIGDCSKKGGGNVSAHGSHEIGEECDMALPVKGGGTTFNEPGDAKKLKDWRDHKFRDITPDELDVPKATRMLLALQRSGNYDVFLDDSHIDAINHYINDKTPDGKYVNIPSVPREERKAVLRMTSCTDCKDKIDKETGEVKTAGRKHKNHFHFRINRQETSKVKGADRPKLARKGGRIGGRPGGRAVRENKQVVLKQLTEAVKIAITKVLAEDAKKTRIRKLVESAIKKILKEAESDAQVKALMSGDPKFKVKEPTTPAPPSPAVATATAAPPPAVPPPAAATMAVATATPEAPAIAPTTTATPTAPTMPAKRDDGAKSTNPKDVEAKESPQKVVKSVDPEDVKIKESPKIKIKSKNP